MKQFKITVNGVTYDVAVEETGSSAPAFAAAPAAAPVSDGNEDPVDSIFKIFNTK